MRLFKFSRSNVFEELEMDIDSLYLAFAENELETCIGREMTAEWRRFRSNDCVDSFIADAVANFFQRTCCVKHKQLDKREHCIFKEEFRCTEMLSLCSWTYCCYDVTSKKLKISSRGLNKSVLEQGGDGLLEMYRRVLNEAVNVISNNKGFQPKTICYEKVRKGLS